MRIIHIGCLLYLFAIPHTSGAAPASPSRDWRIVPGRSLGHIRIGEDAERAMRRLRTADTGDGAAGHSWATWFGTGTGTSRSELDLNTTLAVGAEGKIVRIVRVTSPAFHTARGLRTGSALGVIRAAFPGIRRIAAYQPVPGGPAVLVYDDTRRGITFEVRRDTLRCTAIAVHFPGHSPLRETMPMTAYVRQVNSS